MSPNLTKDPIPGLIKYLAIPASIGFFFNTMYNVVDTYFAGQISTLGQAALSISFPVFFIIIAIGSGLNSGSTALMGNAMGEGDDEKAVWYGYQALSFSFILGIFLTIVGIIISPFLFQLLGASGEYLSLALSYMNTLFMGAIVFTLVFTCGGILNALGDTKPFRNFLILGFFLNIILSPAFLYGWGPLPAMGLSGIALATVIIQTVGAVYLFRQVYKKDLMKVNVLEYMRPKMSFFKDIINQGLPSSINMMTVAVGIFIITYFVGQYGEAAVAAYGVAVRIEQIALIPMIGVNIAVLTLVSRNRGAGFYDRIRETLGKAFKYGAIMMGVALVLLFVFAPWLMNLFTKDLEVIEIGVLYLRIEAFALFAYTTLFLSDAVYQAYKRPMIPLMFGLFRQIIAPSILFYLSVFVFKLDLIGIWFSIFAIIWIAAIVYIFMVRRLVRRDTD